MVQKLDIVKSGQVSRVRSVLSQVVACAAQNVLLLDLALAVTFTTIVIPDLLDSPNQLSLTENQASWFGSIAFLMQPFGAVLSGPLVDYFGRKKSTFIVNFPHMIAWTMMYYASNVTMLFFANGLLGFGTGLMEAPISAYVGEVTEPSLRGILCASTQLFYNLGVLLIYFLGTVIDWRRAALVSLGFPVASLLFIILFYIGYILSRYSYGNEYQVAKTMRSRYLKVPETPVWLLSRGREKEALKSLCYLRGWTTPENVREEFDQLSDYCKKLERCVICCKSEEDDIVDCKHSKVNFITRVYLKFRYVMMAKETLRPFTLMIMFFMFVAISSLTPIRPNMINVCGAFGMAVDGKTMTVMVGIISLVISCVLIPLMRIVGKRKLALISTLGSGLSCLALSIYAEYKLDPSVFSYDTSTFPKEHSYVPLVFFFSLTVFTSFYGLPWVLLAEVFPFRSRAFAQGVVAAAVYIFMFIGTKTFLNFETHLKLSGAFAIYAAVGFVGTIYLYFLLPETEGKTLQEVETNFSGKFKIFANDPIINLFRRPEKK